MKGYTDVKQSNVENLIEKSKALGLMGLNFILSFGIDAICKAYNGIGPQFLPEKLRDTVATAAAGKRGLTPTKAIGNELLPSGVCFSVEQNTTER